MRNKTQIQYEPEICPCCNQTTTYILAIDRGTCHIVKQIARFIGKKGINAVHPRDEMEGAWLSSNEVGNLSRARFHGLIAALEGNPGNYVLTKKGGQFLHGRMIPKYAIISKSEGHQIGYWDPENTMVSIKDFDGPGEYWEGVGYEIEEGNIITKGTKKAPTLF